MMGEIHAPWREAEQDDGVAAPWHEAESEMLWTVSCFLEEKDPSFPQEEGAPLEPDGPDSPAHSKACTISRIKLGKTSLCYPNMTLDVTQALHLLPVPLSWSPRGKVVYSPFPPTPEDLCFKLGDLRRSHRPATWRCSQCQEKCLQPRI